MSVDKIKVLLVDDNKELTRYMKQLLRKSCDVRVAHDGTRGLQLARDEKPDLILADVVMPDLDGFDLLRAIRADERTSTVSVIMLSAHASEDARLEAIEAGADDYLAKPFNARELLAKIKSQIHLVNLRWAAAQREVALQQQLTASRNELRTVLNGTNDAFISLDAKLCVTALNDAGIRLFDRTQGSMFGMPLAEHAREMTAKLETILQKTLLQQSPHCIEYLHASSGRWYHMRCYPSQQGLMLVGTETTEKHQAEEKLREALATVERHFAERTSELKEANELLSAVFDHAPGGIAITNTEGRFFRVNAAYERLTGFTENELKNLTIADLTDPADLAKKKALMTDVLEKKRDCFKIALRYRSKSGNAIWINNFVSLIRSENGKPRFFVKIIQDITDQKLAEQEILTSQQQLRILYDKLQRIREEERIALAREVHDQLGQILSAAKIDIKLLVEYVSQSGKLPSRRMLLSGLQSATKTIEQGIRSVQKIATELRPPELEDLGLCGAIAWYARDFESRTRVSCDTVIDMDLETPPPAIATALFRIFQEAMTNILRHAKAKRVLIQLKRRGTMILLRIYDDGLGISASHRHASQCIGLKGMRERAALVQGRLLLGSRDSGGTLVAIRVPALLLGNDNETDIAVSEFHS